jgi:hypothetical protein
MSEKTPKGMPSAEIPNDYVAHAASQYRDAAEFLLRQLPQLNCVLPLMMVSGLAIELYLKSLNSKNEYHDLKEECGAQSGYRVTAEAGQWGHLLIKLFDGLDPTIKDELQQFYAGAPVIAGAATIRDALRPFDDVFLYSRYPFEDQWSHRTRLVLDDLVALASLVGRFVERLPKRVVW